MMEKPWLLLLAFLSVTTSLLPQVHFSQPGKRPLPLDFDRTCALVCGDLDGDGDQDIVIGNNGCLSSNKLCWNDGGGNFREAGAGMLPDTSKNTFALALGDVDNDGDLDLVCGNDTRQNRLYLNNGKGRFQDRTAAMMPEDRNNAFCLSLADLDGDGDLDLVCADYLGYNQLCLNDGKGHFTDVSATHLPGCREATYAIALADVDGDKDLDLLCGNYGVQNRLLLNDGKARFSDGTSGRLPLDKDPTTNLLLEDLDGDGDPDLACTTFLGQNRFYMNDGSGRFTDVTALRFPPDTDKTRFVIAADLDRDGDQDLYWGNNGQNRLTLNDGKGRFTIAATGIPLDQDNTLTVARVDVDQDGDLDLIHGNWEHQNRLYLNDGRGRFTDTTAPRMLKGNSTTEALVLGDVDGDEALDLLCGDGHRVLLYFNDGRGGLREASATKMPQGKLDPVSLLLADLDGDGDLDLVCGNGDYDLQSRLFLNDGTGTFKDATATRMPPNKNGASPVVSGDVDGDGDVDLIWGWFRQDILYLNDGRGFFSDASTGRLPAYSNGSTIALSLIDVDGDRDLDLVAARTIQDRLYLNDGKGYYTEAPTSAFPKGRGLINAFAVGDVDEDGDLDLVTGSHLQNGLYLNDGRGAFTDATTNRMPPAQLMTTALALGDVDGDGDLDLICGNGATVARQHNELYLNNGQGHFQDATASMITPLDYSYTSALALGDMDGDGDPDLVCGNQGENRLFVNLRRQVDAPGLVRAGHSYGLDLHARTAGERRFQLVLPFFAVDLRRTAVPPFGTFWLDWTRLVPLSPVFIHPQEGVVRMALPVPASPILIGSCFSVQGLHIPDLLLPPAGWRFTNVLEEKVVGL